MQARANSSGQLARPRLGSLGSSGSLTLALAGPESPTSWRGSRSSSTGSLCSPTSGQRAPKSTPATPGNASSSRQVYQKPFEEAYRDVCKQQNLRKLADLFAETDTDDSNEMSLDEFRKALHKPWIQQTFSTLGMQPHQSELVFKSMADEEQKEELSFTQFLTGVQGLVGTNIDGTGTALDIETLRPTRAAKLQRDAVMRRNAAEAAPERRSAVMSSEEKLTRRAFIDSAQAKALLPPQMAKQAVRRTGGKART